MKLRKKWRIVLSIMGFAMIFVPSAYAYIDPGTFQYTSGILASIIPGLVVFFGFLFRPFKRLVKFVAVKVRGKKPSDSKPREEAPASVLPNLQSENRQ